MLQPLQLKEVSARYPHQIAELRDFLHKAGCVPDTEESLHIVAGRLPRDRAFRRDLTSHLWVVIHLSDRTISYADLLGVLAVAAAGAQFAAQAHEDDAHALLRFVMEARQSLDGATRREVVAAPMQPVVEAQRPVLQAVVRELEILLTRARPSPAEFPAFESEETGGSRKPLLWIGVCALAALSVGLVLHYRATPREAVSPAVATAPAPEASGETVVPTPANNVAPAVEAPVAKKRERMMPAPPREHNTYKPSTPVYAPAPPPVKPAPAIASSRPTPAPVPVIRNSPAVTAPSLGVPSSSTNPSDLTNTARGAQTPRLLRRTPEQQTDLIADNRTPETKPASSTPSGTVRATTLGATASRVLYNPTPAYPAAASAAHVQGEVKVQANVDRQGNVASVRVISGPPPLREAALDAAQRWRYRPNTEDGEPATMSAITVFAFQLP